MSAPDGAGTKDGLTPANAFGWTQFDTWQGGGVGNANPADILYVGPGTYVGTSVVNAGTDGTAGNFITIAGVSNLNTLAEAEGDDRPLFALNAGISILLDNFWGVRNLRVTGNSVNPMLRVDFNGRIENCDSVNAGGGFAISHGSTDGLIHRCSGSSPAGTAAFQSLIDGLFSDCIAFDSLVGFIIAGDRCQLIGSLVRSCTTGLSVAATTVPRVVGNTFYDCATAITGTGGDRGGFYIRNIFSECPASAVWAAIGTTDYWNRNNWHNSGDPVNVTRGANALFLDPQFVDPATFDFRVRTEALRNLGPTLLTLGSIAPSIFEGGETNISGTTVPDYSQDQLLRHPLETVVLDGAEVQNVYRNEEIEVEAEDSEGVYLARRATFDFPFGEDLYPTGGHPLVGSTFVDSEGVTYVITDLRHAYQSDFWGCDSLSNRIDDAFDLDDQVTLFRATYGKDRALGKKMTQTADASFTNVAAKIMLRPSTGAAYAGQRQFVENYDVYVNQDPAQLNSGDVLHDGSGKVYEIIGYRERNNFQKFSVIECQLRTVGP